MTLKWSNTHWRTPNNYTHNINTSEKNLNIHTHDILKNRNFPPFSVFSEASLTCMDPRTNTNMLYVSATGLVWLPCPCACLQVNYLNKSLDIFNTLLVYPIYYVLFTSVVLSTSIILFQEWRSMSTIDIITTLGSFVVIVVGVAMLHLFRELQVGGPSALLLKFRSSQWDFEQLLLQRTCHTLNTSCSSALLWWRCSHFGTVIKCA